MLGSKYGVVKLSKGSRYYHISNNPLTNLPDKQLIHLLFHPSEQYIEDSYIAVFELLQDVSLLFLIDKIYKMRIFSPQHVLFEQSFQTDLQHEIGLHGWLTSIRNQSELIIRIIPEPTILKLVDCQPIQFDWSNSKYDRTMNYIPKRWGTHYPLSFLSYPVHFILHQRFQHQLEAYERQVKEEDPEGTILELILNHANVTYVEK